MVDAWLRSSGVTVTIGGFGAMGMYLSGMGLELVAANNCLLAVSGTGDEYRSWADNGESEASEGRELRLF